MSPFRASRCRVAKRSGPYALTADPWRRQGLADKSIPNRARSCGKRLPSPAFVTFACYRGNARPQMGSSSTSFLFDVFSVVLIDVLLAGDNAVLIAMAVKSLPPAQRRIGIAAGAGGAVVLRIILTFFAARLLQLSFLKLAGGVLIFWIAIKLLAEGNAEEDAGRSSRNLRDAIWTILVADITMSVDNILAVAAASKGNLALLIVGLALSITFVVFASSMLSKIMDRYPIVIWIGAAILGRVGAEMILGDPWVIANLHPPESLDIPAQILGALLVVLLGWLIKRFLKNRKKPAGANV